MPNNLQYEKSPYLLQHSNNPVNWMPWGNEAFEKSKKEDKPIFLSIGYSTCHWCHVMAHESFEDKNTADYLNKYFVSIKVDKEERPDIDAVYMESCQMMTGSGGWPLSVFLTPDKKPFFAGTYFPNKSSLGLIGFYDLIVNINNMWKNKRHKVLEAGNQTTEFLQKQNECSNIMPGKEIIEKGAEGLLNSFDKVWGGFGQAPKFPSPHNLLFLMRYASAQSSKASIDAVIKTLDCMACGGIFDQIGGGFSRYSTDRKWLVPHFEKMLYDNALLSYTYFSAYNVTGIKFYKYIAEKTVKYVLCELLDSKGGFYCGQDADSDGVEGKYYVFSPEEIKFVLKDDGEYFCRWFNITEDGNFEGQNIPNRINKNKEEYNNASIETLCKKINEYRKKRTKLHLDDKILTSWNSLMISALAKGYMSCGKTEYLSAAINAYSFTEKNLKDKNERLFIRYRENEAAFKGQLSDYAFYSFALLSLYEATFEIEYLKKAEIYARYMTELFYDEIGGGFYMYADDAEKLITRPKEIFDGAIPSSNSAAGYVFSKLASITGKAEWIEEANKQFEFLAKVSDSVYLGNSFALFAMCQAIYPTFEIVCVSSENTVPEVFLDFVKRYHGFELTAVFKCRANKDALEETAPFTASYPIPERGNMYYLCSGNTCYEPKENIEELNELLEKLRASVFE